MNTTTNTQVSHFYVDSDDRNDMTESDQITTRYDTEPYYNSNVRRYEAKDNHETEARYDTDVRYEAKESHDIPDRHDIPNRYQSNTPDDSSREDNEAAQNRSQSDVDFKPEARFEGEPVTKPYETTEDRYDSHAHNETKSSHDDSLARNESNTPDESRKDNEAAQNRSQNHVDFKPEARIEEKPVIARYESQDRNDTRDKTTENNPIQKNPDRYDSHARYDTDVRYDETEARDETANGTKARYDTDDRYDETEDRYNTKEGYDSKFRYDTDARYALKEELDTQLRYNEMERDNLERHNNISANNDLTDSSPGVRLRHVREKNKWSVKHIADRLFLDMHVIEALEADNYDGLPPTIFVRGYLRNYAKLLELSPESIMESFERLQEQPKDSSITPQKQKKQTSSHDIGQSIITGIVIVTLITLVAWAGLRFYPPNPALSPNPELQTPIASAPQEATSSLKTWSDQQIENNTSLISRLDTDTTFNQPSEPPARVLTTGIVSQPTNDDVTTNLTPPAEPDTPEEEITPTEDPRMLSVHFKARTWIRITDNTGKKLYEGISNSGKVLPLEGTPPFYLKVGNLDGVDIEYQDEIKDIKTFPKRRGRKRLYIVGYEQ